MISDYYKLLKRRVITQVSDGAGNFTPSVPVDTDLKGYIAEISSYEKLRYAQVQLSVNARIFTHMDLSSGDQVVDGDTVYEVVGVYNQFHKYYELKTV